MAPLGGFMYRWAMRSSARRSDVWAWRLIAHCSGPCPGGSVSVPPRASCFGAPLSVPIPRWGGLVDSVVASGGACELAMDLAARAPLVLAATKRLRAGSA
jgi:hypothetical protein